MEERGKFPVVPVQPAIGNEEIEEQLNIFAELLVELIIKNEE